MTHYDDTMTRGRNILGFFDILTNFSFATTETECDY